MNLDSSSEYFMAVAMTSLKYCEELNKDSKKQAETLGFVYRVYQEEVRSLIPQELSLLITYLNDIKEEYYKEYITLYNKEILSSIISNSNSVLEQLEYLNFIEDFYYDFGFDTSKEKISFVNLVCMEK